MALEQGWNPPAWTIGDRLRKAREAAGWKIQDLSAASGVTGQTIGPWELGKRTPSSATLAQVVRALAPRLRAPEADLLAWIRGD